MAGLAREGEWGYAVASGCRGRPGRDVWGNGRGAPTGTGRHSAYTTPGREKIRGAPNPASRTRSSRAARPLSIPPVYERLQAEARGVRRLLRAEHALWFAPSGGEANEDITFHAPTPTHISPRMPGGARDGGDVEILQLRQVRGHGPGTKEWLVLRDGPNRVRRWAPSRLTPMLNGAAASWIRGFTCDGWPPSACFSSAPPQRKSITRRLVRAPCTRRSHGAPLRRWRMSAVLAGRARARSCGATRERTCRNAAFPFSSSGGSIVDDSRRSSGRISFRATSARDLGTAITSARSTICWWARARSRG